MESREFIHQASVISPVSSSEGITGEQVITDTRQVWYTQGNERGFATFRLSGVTLDRADQTQGGLYRQHKIQWNTNVKNRIT